MVPILKDRQVGEFADKLVLTIGERAQFRIGCLERLILHLSLFTF